ncbi:MAG: glycosyltransferase [Minisyncoccia bacterium]
MISGDPKLENSDSLVAKRIANYGQVAEKIFIVTSADGSDYQLKENIFVYPIGKGLPFLRINSFKRKAREIIQKNNLTSKNTIITTQDPFDTGLAGVGLKKEFGFPLEVQIHGDIMSPWFKRQSVIHRIRVSMVQKVLEKADKVRAVSSMIADSVSRFISRDNIYVLPIYVNKPLDYGNREFLPNKYPGFGFIMLTIARLEPEKNVAQAVRLLKRVLTIEPRAGLVILGDGSQRKKLESLSEKLGVREHLSFEGWQDNTRDYLASAHLYMQNSFFEGYGMAIAEAALFGRAIISSDVGIAHDLSKMNACMVAPVNDDKKMFEQLKVALNQEGRVIMGIAGQRVIDSLIVSKEKFLQIQKEQWQLILDKS